MKNLFYSLITFSILLLLWQGMVSICELPDYILPPPSQVLHALIAQRALLLAHLVPTLTETLAGFVLGVLAGCIAGCLLAVSRTLSRGFLPVIIISQSMPVFAIAPVFVLWLGFGAASKIAVTIIMIFFPVTSALYDGLTRTSKDWLELAATMQAGKWRTFFTICLPAALPRLSSGLRIAAVAAPAGAIAGEWVGSSQGLGYLMLNANARLQIDVMFAALIVVIIMSLLLYLSVDRLLKKLIWW
jgi:putative hydroxymethylpyrimidine transport system permease protein